MISPYDSGGTQKGTDDGRELQGGAFPTGYYSDRRPLVYRVPVEHAPRGRTHARTWGPRGSFDRQPVGHQIQPTAGRGVPPPQAPGGPQLADGRDLHPRQGGVALSLSRGG